MISFWQNTCFKKVDDCSPILTSLISTSYETAFNIEFQDQVIVVLLVGVFVVGLGASGAVVSISTLCTP